MAFRYWNFGFWHVYRSHLYFDCNCAKFKLIKYGVARRRLEVQFLGRLYKKVIRVNYSLAETSSNKKRVFES
jgi:hypothetical protein